GRDRPIGPIATVEIAEELPGGALPMKRVLLAGRPDVDDHDVDLLAVGGQRVIKQAARDADGVDPLDLGAVSLSRIAEPRRRRVEQRHVGPRASATRLWNPPPARIT